MRDSRDSEGHKGTLKHTLTVDASFNQSALKVGIGIVIQETDLSGNRGPIIEEHAETYSPEFLSPGESELSAILWALQIAAERQFTDVKVRSDCNQVRKKLAADLKNNREAKGGTMLREILVLARTFTKVQISYCPRRKNQNAHRRGHSRQNFIPKSWFRGAAENHE